MAVESRRQGHTRASRVVVVAILLGLAPALLDARTKNARLQIRLRNEAPLRSLPAWESMRSRCSPTVLSRMDALRGAASAKDQLQLVQELSDDGSVVDDGQEVDESGAALALTSLFLARSGHGPLASRVRTGLEGLPDAAVAAASHFFAKWLAGHPHRDVQACEWIGTLCGLPGRKHVLHLLCTEPDVFAGLVDNCLVILEGVHCTPSAHKRKLVGNGRFRQRRREARQRGRRARWGWCCPPRDQARP